MKFYFFPLRVSIYFLPSLNDSLSSLLLTMLAKNKSPYPLSNIKMGFSLGVKNNVPQPAHPLLFMWRQTAHNKKQAWAIFRCPSFLNDEEDWVMFKQHLIFHLCCPPFVFSLHHLCHSFRPSSSTTEKISCRSEERHWRRKETKWNPRGEKVSSKLS